MMLVNNMLKQQDEYGLKQFLRYNRILNQTIKCTWCKSIMIMKYMLKYSNMNMIFNNFAIQESFSRGEESLSRHYFIISIRL